MDDPLLERLRRALAPEFELDRRLAAGGMGVVFKAREVALDRPVAIKVLRPELATAVARERFLRESRLLARLQHPNIVPVHRADERDGLPFYVMDFIAGRTLADRLADGPLKPDDLIRLGHDLLRGLAAAHTAGIVHRDVKPHNIFFVGGRALLGDFGIAWDAAGDPSELTEDGILIGTRAYMAPEQLSGAPATERSDQYSGAAVLYQAGTGRIWQLLDSPSTADWKGVPGPMVSVLQRALSPDPARRWPSMLEVRKAFDRGKYRGRRRAVAVGALLLLGVLGKFGWTWAFPPPLPADHRVLAIRPFAVLGAPDGALGPTTAEVIRINLAEFPAISILPSNRSNAWFREHPAGDLATARRALDVEQLVSGSIALRGDSVILHLQLTNAEGTASLSPIQVSSEAAANGALGAAAAVRLGTGLGGRPGRNAVNLASENPHALGLFQQGEALFDADAWHMAADRYASAVEADPAFVIARWRLLVARLWAREYSWEEAAALASCCADQLPPLEAGLVRAMSDTNLAGRFAAFDALQNQYGNVGSLPLMLASDLFHRGPLVGRGLVESLAMFEEAVDASPGGTPAPAYDQLVWGKTRLGDRDGARRWLAARRRLPMRAQQGEVPIVDFLGLGYDLRWAPWTARLKLWYLKHFEHRYLPPLAQFFRFSAAWDLPEGQDAVGAILTSELLAKDRASGFEARGLAHLTWGRVADGLAYLDSAATLFNSDEAEIQRQQWRLLLPILGAGRASPDEELAARTWLAARTDSGEASARALWTLVIDALHHDESTVAAELLRLLSEGGATDSAVRRLAQLASAIQLSRTDARGAIAATDSLFRFDSPAPGNDIFARSILHLSRARWFESIGQPNSARREILWYENSDTYRFPVREAQKMEVDAVVSVAARVTRARLLFASADTAAACGMLTRVRQLWRQADPSLRAARTQADSLFHAGCR